MKNYRGPGKNVQKGFQTVTQRTEGHRARCARHRVPGGFCPAVWVSSCKGEFVFEQKETKRTKKREYVFLIFDFLVFSVSFVFFCSEWFGKKKTRSPLAPWSLAILRALCVARSALCALRDKIHFPLVAAQPRWDTPASVFLRVFAPSRETSKQSKQDRISREGAKTRSFSIRHRGHRARCARHRVPGGFCPAFWVSSGEMEGRF